MNRSPWLAQMGFNHSFGSISEDMTTDIAVIGAGIAGVSTCYFLLTRTDKKVLLIEGDRLAHGASGHNAGQVLPVFERPFSDIAEEFGLEKTIEAQKDLLSGWELLDEIYIRTDLTVPLTKFIGYAGLTDSVDIEFFLEKKYLRHLKEMSMNSALVSKQFLRHHKLESKYEDLYQVVDQQIVLDALETDNPKYVAAFGVRKGTLNSALFCEELVKWMFQHYPERFTIVEKSPVSVAHLFRSNAQLKVHGYHITVSKVILCTNGFEHIKIVNEVGEDIDRKFHETVVGRIGYMAGYLEKPGRHATAISYIPHVDNTNNPAEAEPYYYLTRREYELPELGLNNLVCVGGPETGLDNKQTYHRIKHIPEFDPYTEMSSFLKNNFRYASSEISFDFKWHGLMGYTHNGLRLIGPEPRNINLLYNLGCNGVGILPSIFGGWKISEFINENVHTTSVFDPR